jgi:hypothetical protein
MKAVPSAVTFRAHLKISVQFFKSFPLSLLMLLASPAPTHTIINRARCWDALAQSSNDFEFIAQRGGKTNSSQTQQNYSQARFGFA